jgi:hypothetical protein
VTYSFGKTVPPPEGDPNRNVSGRTGGISGAVTRTRDRDDAAAAMRRDADEKRPQAGMISEQEIDRLIAAERRRKEQAAASDRQRLAESQARIDGMKREEDAVRKIQEQIKFLVESCGFSPELATARAHELNRRK